jgi:hypothetical protein
MAEVDGEIEKEPLAEAEVELPPEAAPDRAPPPQPVSANHAGSSARAARRKRILGSRRAFAAGARRWYGCIAGQAAGVDWRTAVIDWRTAVKMRS